MTSATKGPLNPSLPRRDFTPEEYENWQRYCRQVGAKAINRGDVTRCRDQLKRGERSPKSPRPPCGLLLQIPPSRPPLNGQTAISSSAPTDSPSHRDAPAHTSLAVASFLEVHRRLLPAPPTFPAVPSLHVRPEQHGLMSCPRPPPFRPSPSSFKYTAEDVKQLVLEKKQRGQARVNLVLEMDRLKNFLTNAEHQGNNDEVEELKRQMEELEYKIEKVGA